MKEKFAVVDFRMDKICREKLEKLGLKLLNSYYNENVYKAISGHVDINIFTDGEYLIVSPESYLYYKEIFQKLNCDISLIAGKSSLEKKYPRDCSYNLAYTGKYYIANFECIDYEIKKLIYNKHIKVPQLEKEKIQTAQKLARKEGENSNIWQEKAEIELKGIGKIFEKNTCEDEIDKKELDKILDLPNVIDVKQGYANCSICQVDENSIITSDLGLAKTLEKYSLDVLKIEAGHIDLFDFNYGFIGGASGIYLDKVVFFGSISQHPDYLKIKKFIEKKGKKIVELSSEKLRDYGSFCIL